MNRPRKPSSRSAAPTSWEPIEKWYHGIVGEEGHYYHRHVILPGVSKLLEGATSVLDLACGTGVLARALPESIEYLGVDAAPSLIKAAKSQKNSVRHAYTIADITKPLKLPKADFSHATLILALQNLEFPEKAFENAYKHLQSSGKLIIVMNHPCFRIPRQSSWQVDQEKKIQYRRVDRYLSSMTIPMTAHPSKGGKSETTLSFHHPLSTYIKMLTQSGFLIDSLDEWCSNKVSTGGAAKMENRSRAEIPLFLALRAIKT